MNTEQLETILGCLQILNERINLANERIDIVNERLNRLEEIILLQNDKSTTDSNVSIGSSM